MSHNIALLPKGVQNFEELRNGGYHYVDKSDMVWSIANGDKFNLLSRPRRFGKSLLTSTLHYYFEGRKDLFKGLKIMDIEKEWPRRQVFHFDFSGKNTAEELKNHLDFRLGEYEAILGGNKEAKNDSDRLLWLMQTAYEKTGCQVAVLVDEYDSPLRHTLFSPAAHEAVRDVYRSFFPALKTGSHLLKCLFLTGIMKFTQLSLFSVLNTLTNLSFNPKYATVCGITKSELVNEFPLELRKMAEDTGFTVEETLSKMKIMYDGYHFHRDSEGVFNPYSVINALYDKDIMNYWIASGGSDMLSSVLERFGDENEDFDNCLVTRSTLEESDANATDVKLFLYQSGYLTIRDYRAGVYILGFPNREVRQTLYDIVLPNALSKSRKDVDNCISRIRLALDSLDIRTVMLNVQQIVAGTPYSQDNGDKAMEDRFRFIMEHVFYLCDCRIETEREMATGRIDLVAHHPKCILVMELKMNRNGGLKAARNQMSARRYSSAYSAEGKPIYEVSIDFDEKSRSLMDFDIEPYRL